MVQEAEYEDYEEVGVGWVGVRVGCVGWMGVGVGVCWVDGCWGGGVLDRWVLGWGGGVLDGWVLG